MVSEREFVFYRNNKGYSDRNKLYSILKECKASKSKIVVLCIGTDRVTGDCLGPLVGTYLKNQGFKNVFGTINQPVHAQNLERYVAHIFSTMEAPFIIAVDASLGKNYQIGTINVFKGSIKPGTAVKQNICAVGNVSITAVVNSVSENCKYQLQNTRLSIVLKLAEKIGEIIEYCLIY